MPNPPAGVDNPAPTVFLSYASEDRTAARRIGDSLPGYGLEVWYDESELGGGDAWDQKIRKQIRDCDYFMALVSAQTEARHEGYFRREWRLAVERTLDMADDHTFLLPIVIDDTDQAAARVPEKFLAVQWLKVTGGVPTPAFETLCRRLVAGGATDNAAPKKKTGRRLGLDTPSTDAPSYPEFPREESGQRIRFWFGVVGWALRSVWAFFRRWPKWLRILAYLWIGAVLLSKGCMTGHQKSADLAPADAQKLKIISEHYQGSSNKADIAKLGVQIAREFAKQAADPPASHSALLAIPFMAPAADVAAARLADAAFAQVYGRVSISHAGQVGLAKNPVAACTVEEVLERGRAVQASYALCGSVDSTAAPQTLSVSILSVADGAVVWSKLYPVVGTDPVRVAKEVDSNLPPLDDP